MTARNEVAERARSGVALVAMRFLLPAGVVLAALTGGCAMSMPATPPYLAAPTPGEPAPGLALCARTAVAARSLSSSQAAGGWTLGSLGLASTVSGVIATVVNDEQPRLMAAAGLTLAGMALGVVAYNLFLRSETSSRLAQTAELALLEKHDNRAFETCVRAKAGWEASKTSPDGITRELYDREVRENQSLREEVERLTKGAGSAAPPLALPPPPPPLPPPAEAPLGPRR